MENSSRYNAGITTMKKMVSNETLQFMEGMKDISPDLWEMIVAFGFGDVYSREGLTLEKRELITLTSLITQGAFGQLELHLGAALNVGVPKDEIVELIIQCAAYAGFPKACEAMMIAAKVFEQYDKEVK